MNYQTFPTFDEYIGYFEQAGGTDRVYLKNHYKRFITTYCLLKPRLGERKRILDIGAHWLHQSLLYSLNGHIVFAADFPVTLEFQSVKKLAANNNISLIKYSSLEDEAVFSSLRDGQIDCILFTEIIEHITFNPISFWKEIYRVLSPGGRIVITTPNYYSIRKRLGDFYRFIKGYGGGITVEEILGINTYGQHWKEFSVREIVKYFYILSKDFRKTFVDYFILNYNSDSLIDKIILKFEKNIKKLRPNLYIEIELTKKDSGITATSNW